MRHLLPLTQRRPHLSRRRGQAGDGVVAARAAAGRAGSRRSARRRAGAWRCWASVPSPNCEGEAVQGAWLGACRGVRTCDGRRGRERAACMSVPGVMHGGENGGRASWRSTHSQQQNASGRSLRLDRLSFRHLTLGAPGRSRSEALCVTPGRSPLHSCLRLAPAACRAPESDQRPAGVAAGSPGPATQRPTTTRRAAVAAE